MATMGFVYFIFLQGNEPIVEQNDCFVQIVQQQKKSTVATVIYVDGLLENSNASGEEWRPVYKGHSLFSGSLLRTSINASAIIIYSSGTRILINENTEFIITSQLSPESNNLKSGRIKILIYEIYSKLKPQIYEQYSPEMETPTSVASILG